LIQTYLNTRNSAEDEDSAVQDTAPGEAHSSLPAWRTGLSRVRRTCELRSSRLTRFAIQTYLNTRNSAEDEDSAVQDTEGALDFDSKVDVSTASTSSTLRVRLIRPFLPGEPAFRVFGGPASCGKRSRRLDRNSLFTLQLHRVHLCADAVAASDLVNRYGSRRGDSRGPRPRRRRRKDGLDGAGA
jgi:hypothetical protein